MRPLIVAPHMDDEVVIPSALDMNQDHRFLNDLCKIALRPANMGNVTRVLESRSFDSNLTRPLYYITFSHEVLGRKERALEAYTTEFRYGYHPRSLHTVLGSYCNSGYAEGYDLIFNREE